MSLKRVVGFYAQDRINDRLAHVLPHRLDQSSLLGTFCCLGFLEPAIQERLC